MRILVIGAGAMGGYFGGICSLHRRDVTFLVRPRRAEQLSREGLQIISPHGNFTVPVATVGRWHPEPFDLILVGVKSYSLDEAMDQFAPAVRPDAMILPIVDGMGRLDRLIAQNGDGHVFGGMANVGAGVDVEGRIVQFFPTAILRR